jgi:hypothetical protein
MQSPTDLPITILDQRLMAAVISLRPFVETGGEVRAAVKIPGTKLETATSVSFNGTAAKFRVVSGLEIMPPPPRAPLRAR